MALLNMRNLAGMSAAVVMVFGLWQPVPALAQDGDIQTLLNRIERLERDIRTLNVQISRGELAARATVAAKSIASVPAMSVEEMEGPAAARISVRLTGLEQDLRNTTGEVERLNFNISQMNERLDKLVSDLDYRLNALEGGRPMGAASGTQPNAMAGQGATGQMPGAPGTPGSMQTQTFGSPPQTLGTISQKQLDAVKIGAPSGTPVQVETIANPQGQLVIQGGQGIQQTAIAPVVSKPILPEGTPKEQYKYAFKLLRQSEFEKAEMALSAFLEQNPDDPLSDNARYWLGETFYVRGQFVEAAETFLGGYQKSPTSKKAPDTLLKLGMSLASLDKKEQACATFTKLLQDFPKVSDQIQAKLERENRKSNCR